MDKIYVACKNQNEYIGLFSTLERAQDAIRDEYLGRDIPVGDIVWEAMRNEGKEGDYYQATFTIKPLFSTFEVTFTIWVSQPDALWEVGMRAAKKE